MTGYWKTGCSKTGDSLGARVGAVQAKCRADRQDRHETKTDRDRPRSVLSPRSVLRVSFLDLGRSQSSQLIFSVGPRAMMFCWRSRPKRPKLLLLADILPRKPHKSVK